jgi:hypothetical protein
LIFEFSFVETEAVQVPVIELCASTLETATQPLTAKPATTIKPKTTRIKLFDMSDLREDFLLST